MWLLRSPGSHWAMPFLRGREPRLVPSSPRLRHAQLQPHRLKGCPEAGDSNLNPFALLPKCSRSQSQGRGQFPWWLYCALSVGRTPASPASRKQKLKEKTGGQYIAPPTPSLWTREELPCLPASRCERDSLLQQIFIGGWFCASHCSRCKE